MLSGKLAKFFTSGVRKKGLSYFHRGAVEMAGRRGNTFEAVVYGGEAYDVTVNIAPSPSEWHIGVDCTCPYVDSFADYCKHIWAALLKIDTLKLPGVPPRIVNLRFLDGDGSEGGGLEDDEFDRIVPQPLRAALNSVLSLVPPKSAALTRALAPRKPAPPPWMNWVKDLSGRIGSPSARLDAAAPLEPEYVVEMTDAYRSTHTARDFSLVLMHREMTPTGRLGKLKKLNLKPSDLPRLANDIDRRICLMLVGACPPEFSSYSSYSHRYYSGYDRPGGDTFTVPNAVRGMLLPLLFETGRFRCRPPAGHETIPLTWDAGTPWELGFRVHRPMARKNFELQAYLSRGNERRSMDPSACLIDGDPALMIHAGVMSRVETHDGFDWLQALRDGQAPTFAASDRDGLLAALADVRRVPPIDWPPEWSITDVAAVAPQPEVTLHIDDHGSGKGHATAKIVFRYGDVAVPAGREGAVVLDAKHRRQVRRDPAKEREYLRRAYEVGARPVKYGSGYEIHRAMVLDAMHTLLSEGWTVLGQEGLFRRAGNFDIEFKSGIDWFELDGHVDYDGRQVGIPELLKALRSGEKFVRLGDGSMGMIPEEWLAKYASLVDLGEVVDGRVRFAKTQITLIDALLAQMPEARFDETIAAARRRIADFSGIHPLAAPENFVGDLRPYQQDGLAWMSFLADIGWGGCLADDMGLGKTVQVLALLAQRKLRGDEGPSLVVMPKSLIFNWMREAQRFAPGLRVLDYTGVDRKQVAEELAKSDLVLTTYGTLKRDVESLRDHEFNYVVLDEAQAIKNPKSQNARASRLLRARNRLVMTGTPVENRLGDLWSLFEFLNPGMLGSTGAFGRTFAAGAEKKDGDGRIPMLQRMLRPFILRRTKDQVASDLPPRTEETIECAMSGPQAAYYKELRDFYRASLLGRVAKQGLAKSKIHVLEALLRLRQAACHPGLVDESKAGEESAKLDTLLPMITELVEGGHKALIFSQFVKMLTIVRKSLDAAGLNYEYLDGKTQNRDAHVDRFQNDPKCPLFLVSLKAGGVGLNLTAADYVFILDPWWNPAVEAQAIDRTHRIGQDKRVIAYRLIARDTVEAKIIELQKSKRHLAESIITEANSLISELTREDLDVLLG